MIKRRAKRQPNTSTVECVSCGLIESRIYLKDRVDGPTKIRRVFVNKDGLQWNGFECPGCKYGKLDQGLHALRVYLRAS